MAQGTEHSLPCFWEGRTPDQKLPLQQVVNQVESRRVFRSALFPIHRDPSAIRFLQQIPWSKVSMAKAWAKLNLRSLLRLEGRCPRPTPCRLPGGEASQRAGRFGQEPVLENLQSCLMRGIPLSGGDPLRPKSSALAAGFPAPTTRGVPSLPGGQIEQLLFPMKNFLLRWVRDEFSNKPGVFLRQKEHGAGHGVGGIPHEHSRAGEGRAG